MPVFMEIWCDVDANTVISMLGFLYTAAVWYFKKPPLDNESLYALTFTTVGFFHYCGSTFPISELWISVVSRLSPGAVLPAIPRRLDEAKQ